MWFRYFQLYGMTGKLAVACVDIGWTRVDMDTYAREHYHLVNQLTANMVKDNEPDVPDPGDLEWLTSHPAVAGTGKAPQTQMHAGQKKRKSSKIQTRDSGIKGNKEISEDIGAAYTADAIPKTGKGDSSSSQPIFAISKWCNIGIAGICRGLFGGIGRRHQFVCHTCQKSDHYAEGHAACTAD